MLAVAGGSCRHCFDLYLRALRCLRLFDQHELRVPTSPTLDPNSSSRPRFHPSVKRTAVLVSYRSRPRPRHCFRRPCPSINRHFNQPCVQSAPTVGYQSDEIPSSPSSSPRLRPPLLAKPFFATTPIHLAPTPHSRFSPHGQFSLLLKSRESSTQCQ